MTRYTRLLAVEVSESESTHICGPYTYNHGRNQCVAATMVCLEEIYTSTAPLGSVPVHMEYVSGRTESLDRIENNRRAHLWPFYSAKPLICK